MKKSRGLFPCLYRQGLIAAQNALFCQLLTIEVPMKLVFRVLELSVKILTVQSSLNNILLLLFCGMADLMTFAFF